MTTDIQIFGNNLDEVYRFKYFARIAQAPAALSETVWGDPNISKIKDQSDASSCDIDLRVCIRNLATHRRSSAQRI